jgi:hypothetical protein
MLGPVATAVVGVLSSGDAGELVSIEYDVPPVVVCTAHAVRPGAPLVHVTGVFNERMELRLS